MALVIETLQKQASGGQYVSDRRICLTKAGELCEETDPRANTLLVGVNGTLTLAEARRYGLLLEEGGPASKQRKPAEDKQREPESDKAPAEPEPAPPTEPAAAPPPKGLSDMNKAQLQEVAAAQGLSTAGTNRELIDRIASAAAAGQ